jgi:hypothetical protein
MTGTFRAVQLGVIAVVVNLVIAMVVAMVNPLIAG